MTITFIVAATVVAAIVHVVLSHLGMLHWQKLFRLPRKRHESLFAIEAKDLYGGQTPSMEELRSLRRYNKRR